MPSINITDLSNAKLDVDHMARVATSMDSTAVDRLGNVKDTVKGAVDSLKAFNSRGTWVAATAYGMKDVVLVSGTWYVCVVPHTSSAAFATDSASKWRVHQGVTLADMSSGAVPVFAVGAPVAYAAFQATENITSHARYAFLDNGIVNYAQAGFQAHASFNVNVKIQGSQDSDHHHGYQDYSHFQSGGQLGRFSSFWSQLDHTGVGTIVEASLFKANNPLGTGPIATLYGLYIDGMTRGTANYSIFSAGPSVNYFGGPIMIGQISNPAYIKYNLNGSLDIIARPGYGVNVEGPLLFAQSTGSPATIAYNLSGNLDITPRPGYHLSLTAGSLLVGVALPAAGEKLNVTGATTDFISRLYNTHASTPKGIAIVYSGAAPNGTGNEFLLCQDAAGVRTKVLSNGNLQNVNNSYGALSDLKLKENIVDATPKLADLMKVRIVHYNLKTEPGHKQIGVIAQELAAWFPGMIEETADLEDYEVEPARVDSATVRRQKTEKRTEVRAVPELIDGKWCSVPTTITVDAPVYEEHLLVDQHGEPAMELVERETAAVIDPYGRILIPAKPAVYRQQVYQEPIMEDVVVTTNVPARIEQRPTGTTTKAVKYSVFVPMLIKAMQEQALQIEALQRQMTSVIAPQ